MARIRRFFVTYMDGNVRDARGKVTHPGYPASWYRRIVDEEGEKLRVRPVPCGLSCEPAGSPEPAGSAEPAGDEPAPPR